MFVSACVIGVGLAAIDVAVVLGTSHLGTFVRSVFVTLVISTVVAIFESLIMNRIGSTADSAIIASAVIVHWAFVLVGCECFIAVRFWIQIEAPICAVASRYRFHLRDIVLGMILVGAVILICLDFMHLESARFANSSVLLWIPVHSLLDTCVVIVVFWVWLCAPVRVWLHTLAAISLTGAVFWQETVDSWLFPQISGIFAHAINFAHFLCFIAFCVSYHHGSLGSFYTHRRVFFARAR